MKSEWKTCQLGELITFQRGHDLPKSKMQGGIYPVVGSNGIIGYHNEYTTEKPSITIGRSGNVGKPFLYNGKSWSHNTSLYIKEFKNVDPIFIYYYLQTLNLGNFAGGSAVPTLNRNHIHTLHVRVPVDIKEQHRIAAVLSIIDDKIALNSAINRNLEQQAQTIFRALFVNVDDSKPATIADISLNVTDGVHNTVKDDMNGEYLLLSCKNIKGGSLNIGINERHINKDTFYKLRKRTHLAKGDILVSSVGTIGEILILNTNPLNYEFQRSVAMIKPNPELVSSAYVYESLIYRKIELINAAHGAVQQCLFISDISDFPIDVPSREKLDRFNSVVTPIFNTITTNQQENQQLSALRDTLLPKLMNGEIDVSRVQIQ